MDLSAETSNALLSADAGAVTGAEWRERLNQANESEIDKAAQEFEAVFLSQMLAPMMSGIKTEAPFGGGHGEEMFRSMLNDAYADEMVKSGGIGIADQLKTEMLRAQEAAQAKQYAAPTDEKQKQD